VQVEYVRDYAMYASVFGLFSFIWFGWAQENPRSSWRLYLGLASGIALIICLIGVYLSVKNWEEPSALAESSAFRNYLISFYAEFVLGGAGAFVLIRKKLKAYVAPWIVFIVGIHFISLKSVFDDPSLWLLAALMVAVSIIAVRVAPKLQVANSAITGIGAGTVLFGYAILGLIRFMSV
jgi:heme/copper-type cytochrome/quinol oxidase subunit 4